MCSIIIAIHIPPTLNECIGGVNPGTDLLLEDFSFNHFHTAIKMSGGDMSQNEFNGHPCMYNIFRQGNIGSVHTAIVANYSITNRFHDLQIGNVVDGVVVDREICQTSASAQRFVAVTPMQLPFNE
eukprot:COSAG01_NODE_1454_length_10256_cov_4.300748_9_plen_126_part_00